uniref:Uncharacterized protein n=1 Tax=Lactuca sativa TaxID=4236 RepID=A0A9R1VZK4_LACSA|nr:hypothetical protein LSAT_V11C400174870 [Lactuca sativa]
MLISKGLHYLFIYEYQLVIIYLQLFYTFEQEKCKFGLRELNEEFVNEQDEADTDLQDSDSNKDENHYVEAYESKLSNMLNSFERMKEKVNSKLNDAIT